MSNLALPHNYIEECKATMNKLNNDIKRENRFMRNGHLEMYGGSYERRKLETAERKHRFVLVKSETRLASSRHLMPRPRPEKLHRSLSTSPYKRANPHESP